MSRRGDGYDSRLITRFSASATIIVLYANESSAWASTSRRISLVSTVTSEVWKHMPMVNAKYAKSMSAGGSFPGKVRQPLPFVWRGLP